MSVSTPIPDDDPMMMMIAWKKFQATDEYKNSKHWALCIAPFVQAGSEAQKRRDYEIMAFEHRERHVEGSLWNAFMHGFLAGVREQEQP